MSIVDLKHCGYKTVEAAIVGTLIHYKTKIDALNRAYFKKWPD